MFYKLHNISLFFVRFSLSLFRWFCDFILIYLLSIKIHLTHFPGNDNEDKISTLSMVIILVVICKCVFISFALMAVCYRLVEGVSLRAPICCSILCKYQNKNKKNRVQKMNAKNEKSTKEPRAHKHSTAMYMYICCHRCCFSISSLFSTCDCSTNVSHAKQYNDGVCDGFSYKFLCDMRQ